MKQVPVFDFDGLLCDALVECVLVTWNSVHKKSLVDFSDAGLAAIPASFIDRFKVCRTFARHAGHFVMALLDPMPPFHTQHEFESIYHSFQPDEVHRFLHDLVQYRVQVREHQAEQWLRYHHFYPGIVEMLRAIPAPPYIVTAKDVHSVAALLDYHSVPFVREHIFGEVQEKGRILQTIQHQEEVNTAQILFFDDHVPNVLAARQAGYTAYWATWGYHTPAHLDLAHTFHIPALSLETFVQMWQEEPDLSLSPLV